MRGVSTIGLVLLVALSAGCGSGTEKATDKLSASVRDSAGIRIVENRPPSVEPWSVGSEPVFTAGWDEAGPLFAWPQSGRILPDGGALVGDFAEGSMYHLGSDGTLVETWGRKGEGPGEYQGFDAILLEGDTVLVSDGRLQRVTLLAPDGSVRTVPLPSDVFMHKASTVLGDGRYLLVPGEGYRGVMEIRPEWVFQTEPILAVDPGSRDSDTIAELPHLRRWYGSRGASPGPIHVKGRAGGFSEGFAWARSDVPEVRWYDGDGGLKQIARWEEESSPLDADWRDAIRQTFEEAYSSRGAEESFVAAQLAELENGLDRYEGDLPYWDQFFVDRMGNAWLSSFPLPGQAPQRWRVVSRDGVFRGWVDLPGVMGILDITDDRILAVRLNQFDAPAVMMFELKKQ